MEKQREFTSPTPYAVAIAKEAVDNSCIDLWMSLRYLFDVTDDASEVERELMEVICAHPGVKREIAELEERASRATRAS